MVNKLSHHVLLNYNFFANFENDEKSFTVL